MKILELYTGRKWGDSLFNHLGFDGISIELDGFDYLQYPTGSFSVIFININHNPIDYTGETDFSTLDLGLDCIEYYNPSFWILNDTNKGVNDDIAVWGLPYRDIHMMRGGKLQKIRVWTSIYKWRPPISNIYITEKHLLSELLTYTQTQRQRQMTLTLT